jgi:hypothetical protein
MTTPVERAARALYGSLVRADFGGWEALDAETRTVWMADAERAIRAALDVDELARLLSPAWPSVDTNPWYQGHLTRARNKALLVADHLLQGTSHV